jgi:hypothetical protein
MRLCHYSSLRSAFSEEFLITDTFLAGTLPTGIGLLTNLRKFVGFGAELELQSAHSPRLVSLAHVGYFEALRTRIEGTLPSELGKLSMLGECAAFLLLS